MKKKDDEDGEKVPEKITRRGALKRMKLAALAAVAASVLGPAKKAFGENCTSGYTNIDEYTKTSTSNNYTKIDKYTYCDNYSAYIKHDD